MTSAEDQLGPPHKRGEQTELADPANPADHVPGDAGADRSPADRGHADRNPADRRPSGHHPDSRKSRSEAPRRGEAHGHHHRDVSGGWLRPAVFGAMDGLVTNVSLIAGVGGGGG